MRLAEAKSPIAYGAVLVSSIVLVGFAVMLWLVIREEVPANQRDMVTLLLGTLAGMASSVVAYWVGSSNGSMQKNGRWRRRWRRNEQRQVRALPAQDGELMSQGDEFELEGEATTNPEREKEAEGGQKREHAGDGMTAAPETSCFFGVLEF